MHLEGSEDPFVHVVGESHARSFGDMTSRSFNSSIGIDASLAHAHDGIARIKPVARSVG